MIAKITLIFLLLLAAPVLAYDRPAVVDDGNLLGADDLVKFETQIENFNSQHRCLLVIITVPTISGQDVDKYSSAVARTWGVHYTEGKDDGILLLISRDEGIAHLRIGSDYNGQPPAERFEQAVATNLAAPFKQGDMMPRFQSFLEEITREAPARPWWEYLWILPVLLVLIIIYANTLNRKRVACVSCGKQISSIVHRCPYCLALQPISAAEGSAPSIGLESEDLHRIAALRILDIRFLMWQSTSFGGFTAGGPGELPKPSSESKPFDGEAVIGGF